MCDESNDYGNDKCFVILVKVFDDNLGSTQTRFLAVMLILKEHSQLLKKFILKNGRLCSATKLENNVSALMILSLLFVPAGMMK
jgi:hypothetical protein